jgi:hypothetical protein
MIMDVTFETDTAIDDRQTAVKRGMAMAYVWGRQDGGEGERDTGYSQAFASVYALASKITEGYGVGPLQSAFHEWHDTGRVLVSLTGGRIMSVQVPEGAPDTTRAAAYPVPWAGGSYSLPYWPGKITDTGDGS